VYTQYIRIYTYILGSFDLHTYRSLFIYLGVLRRSIFIYIHIHTYRVSCCHGLSTYFLVYIPYISTLYISKYTCAYDTRFLPLCMYVNICILYVCTYVHMYICTYVYIYTYMYIYIRTNRNAMSRSLLEALIVTNRYTLQHTATHCNTPYLYSRINIQYRVVIVAVGYCNTLQHTATHCNTLQHTATQCNTLQHTIFIHIQTYSIALS